MLNLNSLAASPCVISFFLVFFNATSRSLSTWVISSCPSCIPKAWGCQDDISTLLKDDILILLPQQYPGVCQSKVEMSPPWQSRNVAFGLGLSGVHGNLRVPVKRRRALLASNPIKE